MTRKYAYFGAALAALAMLGSSAVAQEQTLTLNYSAWLPATHWLNADGVKPWSDEVEKVTQGRVKIAFTPKGVGSGASQFDTCRDGLADVCYFVAGYTPGRFPLATIGELPFLGNDPAVIAPAYYRMYKKHLEQYGEFKDVQIMSLFGATPERVYSTEKPLNILADFSGMKMRTANPTSTRVAELLGAIPVLKGSGEVYELVSSGVVTGEIASLQSVNGSKSIELHKFTSRVDGGLSNAVSGIIINRDKWAEISPEDQAAIMAVSGEKLAKTMGEGYAKADQVALDIMKERNYTIGSIEGEPLEALKTALKPIEQAWIDQATQKGVVDPAAILADFRADIAAAEKK